MQKLKKILAADYVFTDFLPEFQKQDTPHTPAFTPQDQDSLSKQLHWLVENIPKIRISKATVNALLKGTDQAQKAQALSLQINNLKTLSIHLLDLNKAGGWLLQKGYTDLAISTLQICYETVIEFFPKTSETCQEITCNLGLALIRTSNYQSGLTHLNAIIATYQDTAARPVKERVAKALFAVAGHTLKEGKLEEAQRLIDQSLKLRLELYAKDSIELDRIYVLQSNLFIQQRRFDDALRLLQPSYEKRCAQDPTGLHLLPVLECLITIYSEQRNTAATLYYLQQLHTIHVTHFGKEDPRSLHIALKIHNESLLVAPKKSAESYLDDIEIRLSQYPISEQSLIIGQCYTQLGKAYFLHGFFTPTRELDQKFEKLNTALLILGKAEQHILAANPADGAHLYEVRSELKNCLRLLNYLGELDIKAEAEIGTGTEGNLVIPAFQDALKALSDFSSEVRHSLVADDDKILTVADFLLLPAIGTINPFKLRTAQGGINSTFRDGRSINELKKLSSPTRATTPKSPKSNLESTTEKSTVLTHVAS